MRYRFWSTVVGRGLSLFTPIIVGFLVAEEWRAKVIITTCSFVFLGLIDWFGVWRPIKRIEEKQRKMMEAYVKPIIDGARYGEVQPKLRVNVMRVQRALFIPRFVQCYQYKMDGHPDAALSFSTRSGFCGEVFRSQTQDAFYKDLRQITPEELKGFRWTNEEQRKTKHVKAVVSTPIFRKIEKAGGVYKYQWFGVVNVDAIDDAGAEYLADDRVLKAMRSLAEFAQITFE